MGGTVRETSDGDLPPRADVPTPVASIRVDGIRAFRLVDDDDGPILIVTDGDATVEFSCGLSGLSEAAALGAERLAQAAREYALGVESGAR
jgi:hypothetical protein